MPDDLYGYSFQIGEWVTNNGHQHISVRYLTIDAHDQEEAQRKAEQELRPLRNPTAWLSISQEFITSVSKIGRVHYRTIKEYIKETP